MFVKDKKGFSMIEISVVLAITSIGILGVFSLVAQNIQVQRVNQNLLVASMLAQEGIELVRNIRDTNWLKGLAWASGFSGMTNNDFRIDYYSGVFDATDNTPADITDTANLRLYLKATDNYYTHESTGNTATQFYRWIKVTPDSVAPIYYTVESKVQWKENGVVKSYPVVTYLFDWR